MGLPIPEVTVALGEGCHDLTTGKPYVPDGRPEAESQPAVVAVPEGGATTPA
ncbi:MAG: hypothetical protein ACXVXZ_03450 [Mycobacteriaceae bacterium]